MRPAWVLPELRSCSDRSMRPIVVTALLALSLGCGSTATSVVPRAACVEAPTPTTTDPEPPAGPVAVPLEPAGAPVTCMIADRVIAPYRPPHVPSVPLVRVARACERISSRSRRFLRAPPPAAWQRAYEDALREREEAEESDSGERIDSPEEELDVIRGAVGTCVSAGTGAWVLEPLSETSTDGLYELSVRLTHVDADGTVRVGLPFDLHTDGVGGVDGDELTAFAPEPVHDYDGDGRIEVALALTDHLGARRTRVYTAASSGVVEVPLPLEVGLGRWVDYDADGRPDLLADRLYVDHECYEDPSSWGIPELLLHAGPGLAFSADDEVATRYARELCPCAPSQLLAPWGHPDDHPLYAGNTLVRVACARLWGASLEELEERLGDEIDALEDERHVGDVCAQSVESLLSYAEAEPPLRLAP